MCFFCAYMYVCLCAYILIIYVYSMCVCVCVYSLLDSPNIEYDVIVFDTVYSSFP